jgi:hypothetical protein
MDPMTLRGAERLIAILIGGMSVVLGFLLFLRIPSETNATGQIKLPGGISIMISRIGPGIFFAVFGAVLVALSFYFGVKIDMTRTGNQAHFVGYSGIGSDQTGRPPPDEEERRARVVNDIRVLNSIEAALRTDLSESDRARIATALDRVKLALMTEVWSPEWGQRREFEQWFLNALPDPPDNTPLRKAVDIYGSRYGGEARQ